MKAWRWGMAAVLVALIGVPLALPFLELARDGAGWHAWSERERLATLTGNTLRVVLGTLALALPAGVVGAVLLYRTDLPLRNLWRFLTVLAIFVPLPLFASAWQATLGTGGLLPSVHWGTLAADDPDVTAGGLSWKPWAYGIGAATWIHAVAGLPWVILIVGQGLRWVEAELEEEALLAAPAWRVLILVTLRRAGASIAAAGLWVTLQTATEITVTDMMQVRTFAEEVYYQFVLGDRSALARGVALNLPVVLLLGVVVLLATRRLEATLPPLENRIREPRLFPLGKFRWPALAVVVLAAAWLVGVPLLSLVWKAGSAGGAGPFSAAAVVRRMTEVFAGKGRVLIGQSLAFAILAGGVTGSIAFVCCWLAAESRRAQVGLLLASLALALPGPIIGLGVKATIQSLMDAEKAFAATTGLSGFHPAGSALYYGPSPLPLLWVTLVRFFPFAVAVLWPIVRLFPTELRESARLDGASPRQELAYAVLPLLAPAAFQASLGVAVLSLGEVSAGKLVETPGSSTFAHELFNQMHYGVQDRIAALCLVLLALVTIGAATFAVVSQWIGRDAAPR